MWAKHKNNPGFTIVELLIVIVVIAILAAISIVAYNGIQNRANASAVSSALAQAAKKIAVWQVDNPNATPNDLALVGVINSSNVSYQYKPGTAGVYCITATSGNASYKVTDTTQPSDGVCAGHGRAGVPAITNLVTNPSIEISTAGWGPRKSATFSRSTVQKHSGLSSMMVVTPGADIDEGLNLTIGTGIVSSGIAGDHMASAWVMAPSGTLLRIFGEEYASNGTYVSGAATSFTANGAWQRVSVLKNIVSASSKVAVNIRTNSVSAVTYYVDDVMVTQSSQVYNYADGTFTDWDWNGQAHNASSSGPPI